MKNDISHSRHSRARLQQRGVSDLALRLLLDYGDEEHQRDGEIYRYFSRQALRQVSRDLDDIQKNLSRLAKVVAVELEDGTLKTVMLQTRHHERV